MCSNALKVEVLFISVTVVVSVLCYNCSLRYKVQFPKLLYTSVIVSGSIVGCGFEELMLEYSKTGDFILDLYWSGCRGDWPSANT